MTYTEQLRALEVQLQSLEANPIKEPRCESAATGRERHTELHLHRNTQEWKAWDQWSLSIVRIRLDKLRLRGEIIGKIYQKYFDANLFKLSGEGNLPTDDKSVNQFFCGEFLGSLKTKYCAFADESNSKVFVYHEEIGYRNYSIVLHSLGDHANDQTECHERWDSLYDFHLPNHYLEAAVTHLSKNAEWVEFENCWEEFNPPEVSEIVLGRLKMFKSLAQDVKSIICQNYEIPENLIPVPYFGPVNTAVVAGLSLNPSYAEFWNNNLDPLVMSEWRFDARDSNLQLSFERILEACDKYFQTNPYWEWFNFLQHANRAFGIPTRQADLKQGKYVHLDYILWPTTRRWSELKEHFGTKAAELLANYSLRSEDVRTIIEMTKIETLFVTSVNLQNELRAAWLLKICPELYTFNIRNEAKIKVSDHRVWFGTKKVRVIGTNLSMEWINTL